MPWLKEKAAQYLEQGVIARKVSWQTLFPHSHHRASSPAAFS